MKEEAQKRREDEKREYKRIRQQEVEERALKKELFQIPEAQEQRKMPREAREEDKKPQKKRKEQTLDFLPVTWAASYLPIRQVKNGIILTSDNRYVKLVEILPINFLLRSPGEQRNIIFSFMSYLKIAPSKIQFKVVSKKADILEYIEKIREEAEKETDERCRLLQEDYARLIKTLGTKEAITRRFFLIFEYQSYNGNKNPEEKDVFLYMKSAVQTAKKYLALCGNVVLEHENETRFIVETFYQILNRQTSMKETLDDRIRKVRDYYLEENGRDSIPMIPVTELFAPETIEFRNWNYAVIDGVYHTYLFIPSQKYRTRVPAGWLSLLINAGEGIDVDVFFFKQDKTKSMERIGRRIRLNRSKIKDTYDTNSDFDNLSESIHAGYYLKRGLGGSEEFYYMSTLITITGYSAKEVEWRAKEMTKLLNSQDIGTASCIFREEQAFLSTLPLLNLNKKIYARAKRNVLTSGVAACYPFASYEMSDKDGIMMGVNKANSSLVIVDIFNTQIYKNANIAILGTSGAGKTFTMQLMALRMRRKNIQVFIIAPDKGHEFARACTNIGGEFIQISPASHNCINVMEIRPTDTATSDILDGYMAERSELAMKIQSLHIFFSLLIPDMTHEEKQLLDEALVITYQEKGITHDNQSLADPKRPGYYRKMPILGDLHEVLQRKAECRRIANILNRLVNGSASSFNQQTNVNLNNKYVVLDISELSGDLLLGMFVAIDFVWTKAKEDRTVEKAIFVDEAWKLLASNELAGEYLLEIFKVIRAYGGAAVCATQDLADFFALKGGKLGRGILNNSKTKIILNMENAEAEHIREELDLSEAEMTSIIHFERGNGLISTNNNNLIVEFKASQLEKDLITTDRRDLQELKSRIQKYGADAYGRKG
ncbi:helicase HerA domain-containing protein [Ruminococcus sp. 5_1_39BFAA]|uniref:VirB4 family type IV secretion system protein n=1 Tax=Ruminococcus sp. 5_1_39BFAA TaxID=457412 RepID=UPI00356A4831